MNYYLSSSNHVTGPYSRDELLGSLDGGMVPENSLICEEGTENWVSVLTLRGEVACESAAPTPFSELDLSEKNQVNVYNYYNPKSSGVAVILEVLPGIFLQTFGIGNLYAGNIATGLILMFTYWAAVIVNALLVFVVIGFVTWPLTFIAYLVISIITANRAANRANYEMYFKTRPME